MALKTKAHGRGDCLHSKDSAQQEVLGTEVGVKSLLLFWFSNSGVPSPLAPVRQHVALSAERAQLMPHLETEQVQVFLFTTRNYCQTPHPGCRTPCFASSRCPRAHELARPAPGSLCQQPDGNAGRHKGVRGLTSLLSSMRCSTDMLLKTLGLKTTSQGTG